MCCFLELGTKWPGNVCWKVFKAFKADIASKAVFIIQDISARSSHQYWKMRLAWGCFGWHYYMYDMLVDNGQQFPWAKLQDNDIILFNICTCIKELHTYCISIIILQIIREKRTYSNTCIKLLLVFHGEISGLCFWGMEPMGNFILPLQCTFHCV